MLGGWLILTGITHAQEITQTHEMLIKDMARKKVLHYTRNLELLASTDRSQRDLIENTRARLYSMAENQQIRVYDDFTPPSILEHSAIKERVYLLDTYLKNMHIFYPDNNLKITYGEIEPSEVFYDASKERYFIKVTADRQLKGDFYYQDQRMPYEDKRKVDFYLSAEVKDGIARVGKIFEIDEHKDNTQSFVKATVRGDAQTLEETRQIRAATENAQPYAFRGVKPAYKRGKTYTIQWTGGSSYDLVQLELVSGNNRSNRIPLTSAGQNTNQFVWTVSPALKAGKQYRFQLEDITKDASRTSSSPFVIKRRIPLGAKVAGGLVVGASLAYVVYSIIDAQNMSQQADLPLPPSPR